MRLHVVPVPFTVREGSGSFCQVPEEVCGNLKLCKIALLPKVMLTYKTERNYRGSELRRGDTVMLEWLQERGSPSEKEEIGENRGELQSFKRLLSVEQIQNLPQD